jgi:hypothetical protein
MRATKPATVRRLRFGDAPPVAKRLKFELKSHMWAGILGVMFEVQAKNFGVSVESVFQKPISFRQAQPETCAEKLVALLHSWNLKPTRLALYNIDSLYSYECNFAVYGESVKIFLNSERFNLSLTNGRIQADVQTIGNVLVGFSECFLLPEDSIITANLFAHASFDSTEKHKEYIAKFSFNGANVELSGGVAHLKTKTWTEPIRFQIDRSEAFASSLFLSWITRLKGWPIKSELLTGIRELAEETSEMFLLKFAPLPVA